MLAFKSSGYWKLVSGKEKRPEAEGEAQDAWEDKDSKAMVMLISSVEKDLYMMVSSCETAPTAWKYLAERFDRDTGNVAIYLFRSLTNLRYQDGDNLQNHLDTFHQMWTKMTKRCQSSNQAVAKAMRAIFESDEVKGSFFLTTLPDTMDHIIDNLSTRNVTTFTQIEPKMLDISEKHTIDTVDSNAYYTNTRKPPKGNSKPKDPTSSSKSDDKEKECTWCRKHNLKFIGHVYTNCNRLKEQRDKDKKGTSSKKQKGNDKKVTSNYVSLDSDSEDDSTVNAFCAGGTSSRSSINTNGKRAREVSAYASSLSTPSSSVWVFDTGASRHMSGVPDDFVNISPCQGEINIAGGLKIPIEGIGTVRLRSRLPNGSIQISEMTNVLHSRELRDTRLFSWPYVRKKGWSIQGKGDNIYLLRADGTEALWAKYVGGCMEIQLESSPSISANFASFEEFHAAIGHFSVENPTRLYRDGNDIPKQPKDFHCEACKYAKSIRKRPKSLPQSRSSSKPFELIHSDLSGKFSQKSLGGSRYFITLIDDYTRFSWVYFLEKKADAPDMIEKFMNYVRTQFDTKVERLRSDNGGEYVNARLQKLYDSRGIIHEAIPPYSHESNGVAERFNRTIITMARVMIDDDSLLFLWAEAIKTATFLRNIAPHRTLPNQTTPFQALFDKKPSVGYLQPFGQAVYAHIPKETRQAGSKLLHRAEHGLLVGYGRSSKIYRVYVPSRGVIMETRDVEFRPYQSKHSIIEGTLDSNGTNIPPFQSAPGGTNTSQPIQGGTSANPPPTQNGTTVSQPAPQSQNRDPRFSIPPRGDDVPHFQQGTGSSSRRNTLPSSPAAQNSAPPGSFPDEPSPAPQMKQSHSTSSHPSARTSPPKTRSGRTIKPTSKVKENARFAETEGEDIYAFVAQHFSEEIPLTYREAQSSPNWLHWKEAIASELDSHISNGTWELVPHVPDVRNIVGTRWVFATKHHADGRIARYKARLVAQGFSQVHGIDFEETYAPVVRYDSLRFLLRIAAANGHTVHQMDFDTAYLNSSLEHEIYARVPAGYDVPRGHVLKLKKALYGLKQSGREWFGLLRESLLQRGFKQMTFDPCVFRGDDVYLGVYVDDLPISGPERDVVRFKAMMSTVFKCKDMGICRYLLGLEIDVNPFRITMSQRGYAQRILQRFDMAECNGRNTPLDPGCFPQRTESDIPVDESRRHTYQRLMGSLNYLVTGTRADLAFPISMLSTFNSNPSDIHLALAKQVLRYVKATSDYKLVYAGKPHTPSLRMYADASWGTDPDTAKSFSGYVLQMDDASVCWSAKRQSCVAKSTCEAEYMSCSYATSHLIWAKSAVEELLCPPICQLLTDNQAAIHLASDHRITARSKHIAIHFHFVRERLRDNEFSIQHIPSADNLADICTKAVPLPLLRELRSRILRDNG